MATSSRKHRILIASAVIVIAGVIAYLAYPAKVNRDAQLPVATQPSEPGARP